MPSPPLSIVQSLSPRIAVLTSDDVITSCEANGCRGLEELLRPWEGSTERVSILSSTLLPSVHPTFPLRFVSWTSVYGNPAAGSPNPDIVTDLIGSLIAARKPDEEQHYPLTRSLVLSSRQTTSHETFNHPVAILFAVTSSEPDPLGALKRLTNTVIGAGQSIPWMDGTNLLRFYVVVHDVAAAGPALDQANEVLATVKKVYGPHSTMLVINSRTSQEDAVPPQTPDVSTHPAIPLPRPFTPDEANPSALSQVYASALSSLTLSPMSAVAATYASGAGDADGADAASDGPISPGPAVRKKRYAAQLSADDTQRLAALVRELVVQSLVPWMEARVREWNEVYHANKRGITGRLFGAGRKFFGSRPSTPAPNSMQAGYNTVKGYYPVTTIEAITRRLADFGFMLRDYRFAAGIYDSLRRDFAQDRAQRYAAAATEMYGLSTLLSHQYFLPITPPNPPVNPFTTLQHTDISSWLEQSVLGYNSRGSEMQIQLDALRITILYYEAWKMIGEWRGVGAALVRAAGEGDEVPSAVLIEEAAAADVKGGKTNRGRRRRAFHLIMAARRYETAGLKAYSRRCLDRASAIYRAAPWTAAQDRIEYSLGRQAYTLSESDVAVEHFLRLLRREDTGVMGSQGGVLEDLALAYEQLASHPDTLAAAKDKLQLVSPVFDINGTRIITASSHASSSGTSASWDDLEVQALNSWDRKGKKPMRLLPPKDQVLASVGESFIVEVLASNPLNAPLILSDITLAFDPADDIEVETIPEITLDAYEERPIGIAATARRRGTVSVTAVSFRFHGFLPYSQSLRKRGKRLAATKAHRLQPTYADDHSLTINVQEAIPCLSAEMVDWPQEVYEGEEVDVVLRLRNTGSVPVQDVALRLNELGWLRTRPPKDQSASVPNVISPEPALSIHPATLQPGEEAEVDLILCGVSSGVADLLGLVIFSGADETAATSATGIHHIVAVSPVASVTASVRAGSKGYLLDVRVANASAEVISVVDVSFIGPAWDWRSRSDAKTGGLLPNQTLRIAERIELVAQASKGEDLWQQDVVDNLGRLLRNQSDQVKRIEDAQQASLPVLEGLDAGTRAAYVAARTRQRLAYLTSSFPAITPDQLLSIFPLVDPLDLDVFVRYSIEPTTATDAPRRTGTLLLSGLRPAPEFSIVESLRLEVERATASGEKQIRTMYEETGRQRQILMESVLDGVLAAEDDPVTARVRVGGATRGIVEHDFVSGALTLPMTVELINRSPLLPVRWQLRLPPPAPGQNSADALSPSPAQFIGSLVHRGTLQPGESRPIDCMVSVMEPCLISLGGWTLETETGSENGDQGWVPRRSWSRAGDAGVIQIQQVRS